ncbi:MAG: hypothetical protein WCA85_17805 [Paraburkholderia sp.]|uniref:hypothetical protein n=1 Tax=Paraburkholderia sp. TaxID=1926495 RepID=UPI003C3D6C1F
MSAKPISNPKIAIVASLLMGGVLTIAALELRPDGSELSNDQPGVESRPAPASVSQDRAPPPGAVASGGVVTGGDAAISQVLDAVRFCLDRNDLDSAKVLLQAEVVLHKDDPRVMALQHEVQMREARVGHAPPVALAGNPPTTVPLPPWVAESPASRPEHSRYAELPQKEHAANPARNARTRYAAQTTVELRPAQRVEADRPHPPSAETTTSSVAPASPAAVPMMAAVAPPVESLPVHQTPVAPQAAPVAQSAPPVEPAPPAVQPETTLTQSNQVPKTRAEVRMELERARSDGDLPRFGNPDPAGPGGAMSMTVNPGAMSH